MTQLIKYQGFWYLARMQSCKIQVNLRNSKNMQNTAKLARNLIKYMSINIFETYLGYWGCLIAVN